jgi:tetratricopeptide (TPR) repeat protein
VSNLRVVIFFIVAALPLRGVHGQELAVNDLWKKFESAARSADETELKDCLKAILKLDPTNKDAASRLKAVETGEADAADKPMIALTIRIHLKHNAHEKAVREAKKMIALESDDWMANCILAQDAIQRKNGPAIEKHLKVVSDPMVDHPPDLGGLLYALELHRQAGKDANVLRTFTVEKVIPSLRNANLGTIPPAGRIQILACYIDTGLSVNDQTAKSLNEYTPWAVRLFEGVYSDARKGRDGQSLSQLISLLPPFDGLSARFRRLAVIDDEEKATISKWVEEQTRRVCATLRELDPKNPSGYVGEVNRLIRSGNHSAAREMLDQGRAGCGAWNLSLLTALVAWAKAANQSEEMLPQLLDAAKQHPDVVALWQLVAEAAEAAHKRSVAIEAIQKARERTPEDPLLIHSEARLWADADRHEKALDLLDKLPELIRLWSPNVVRTYVRSLAGAGKTDESRKAALATIAAAEKSVNPTLAIAPVRGLIDAPAKAPVLELAVELADRLGKQWPDESDVIDVVARARFRAAEAGDPAWQADRSRAAVAALERAVARERLDPWPSAMLAWVRIKANIDPDKAWDDSAAARRAESDPATPALVREALGAIYLHHKKYDDAVRILTKAAETSDAPTGPLLLLAETLHAQGKFDKAKEIFARLTPPGQSDRLSTEFKRLAKLFKE